MVGRQEVPTMARVYEIPGAELVKVLKQKKAPRWRDPWALAALLRRSRKARDASRYQRHEKHRRRGGDEG